MEKETPLELLLLEFQVSYIIGAKKLWSEVFTQSQVSRVT